MADELRIYFHPRSPYSRIGLQKLAEGQVGGKIPTKLHILTRAAGTDGPPNPMATRAKRSYLMQDVPRSTLQAGLPIQTPDPFDPDCVPFYAMFYAARAKGADLAFAAAVSNARWGEGKNIGETDVLMACAAHAGTTITPVPAEDLAVHMEADSAQIEKDGAFGVPFAVLERDGKKEKFFGQDRFDLLVASLG